MKNNGFHMSSILARAGVLVLITLFVGVAVVAAGQEESSTGVVQAPLPPEAPLIPGDPMPPLTQASLPESPILLPMSPAVPAPVPLPERVSVSSASILGYHTVRYRETLFCIGRAYKVSPWAIARQNGISYPYTLWVGQRLAIPNVPWTNIPAGPVCQRQFDPWLLPTRPAPSPTLPPSWPSPPIPSLPSPQPPIGSQPSAAWLGEYFSNMELGGSPDVQHLDPAIDFDWGGGSPFPGQIPKDLFSVRWTRDVYFEGGTYRFWAWVDDGVRLYVNDRVIINEWRDADELKFFDDAVLVPGVHHVKVEYYEHGHEARISVWWERLR